MAIITYEVEIPDDIELSEVHALHTEVIAEAIKTFIMKNHDYFSCWRLYDVESVCRELLVRMVRILSLLKLEQSEGHSAKVAEGIASEFVDSINWCVFGNLLYNNHGVDLFEVLSKFGMIEENEPLPEPRQQKTLLQKVSDVIEKKDEVVPDKYEDIRIKLQDLIENKLSSGDPFPLYMAIDVNDPVAMVEQFNMGESPYYYVRADVLYPDKVQAVQKQYPDKVIFLRMTIAGQKSEQDDHSSVIDKTEQQPMSEDELRAMLKSFKLT